MIGQDVTAFGLLFRFGIIDAVGFGAMVPHDEDDDPKKPRPVRSSKKHEGMFERDESRQDDEERDYHRHVLIRC